MAKAYKPKPHWYIDRFMDDANTIPSKLSIDIIDCFDRITYLSISYYTFSDSYVIYLNGEKIGDVKADNIDDVKPIAEKLAIKQLSKTMQWIASQIEELTNIES